MLFNKYALNDLPLANRIVMPPVKEQFFGGGKAGYLDYPTVE